MRVAIVGLPNVGKSTLFNRLVGKKLAIVDNLPNVTRDRKEGIANFCGLRFIVVDTGGVDDGEGINFLVAEQVKLAVTVADVVLYVVDIRVPIDHRVTSFAKRLRKMTGRPVIYVVNKCEGKGEHTACEMQLLDFIGPVYISAEHNLGMTDLYDAMAPLFLANCGEEKGSEKPMCVSIVGQPNVGKSTFINRLLGENRLLMDSQAGTTRDAVDVAYNYQGLQFLLFDTAGIRKSTKVVENVERLAIKSAVTAISKSNVVILMVDFTMGISHQDLFIADTAMKKGKGVIVALNKSDVVNNRITEKDILAMIKQNSKMDFEVPIVKISALKGTGCNEILDRTVKLYKSANVCISTSRLNKWLSSALEHHSPYLHNGKRVRFKYITQIGRLPPAFVVYTNVGEVEDNYQRYLRNHFMKSFAMQGVPVRMIFRKSANPYLR